jgi:hypothetical protein
MKIGSPLASLVKFDHWSWFFFVVWFGIGLILHIAGMELAANVTYWGIVLLLVCYHVRLFFVAEQFKIDGHSRYRLLTYLLLFLLITSVAVQMLR